MFHVVRLAWRTPVIGVLPENSNHGLFTLPFGLGNRYLAHSVNVLGDGVALLRNGVALTSGLIQVLEYLIDQNLATVPANAIIDKIEFFGINGFATKGSFSIGLGQLNGSIMVPLIENATAAIANEKVGGCREFASNAADGRNAKTLVLLQSNVNAVLEHPVTAGSLQVVIEYHLKPTPT